MANNYLHFSEQISDLTDEEIKFLNDAFGWTPPYNEDNELPEGFEWPHWYDQDAEGVGFEYDLNYDLNQEERSLWVYAEEYGNVDTLAALVHELIVKFRPDYVFTLTYSETCSKPRLGEFGGGAIVVSKYGTRSINAHGWVSEESLAIADRIQKEKGE